VLPQQTVSGKTEVVSQEAKRLAIYFFSSFSPAKTLVKPQNHLNPSKQAE